YRAGRFEQALRTLEEATRFGEGWTNSEAWPLLAMTHHRLGHAEEARRWLERTRRGFDQMLWDVRWHPFDIRLVRRNDFELPAACFTRAIEVRLKDPTAWVARAWFHACQGKWHQAEADFDRAMALGPPDRPGAHWDWHCHALLRLYLGDTAGYRRLCRQTLQR